MIKRLTLVVILLLLGAVAAAVGWVGWSEPGLQWALRQAQPWMPAELTLGRVEGRLTGPLTLQGMEYRRPDGERIASGPILLDWNPAALWYSEIDIETLQVASLRVELAESTDDSPAAATPPRIPELPFRIRIGALGIDDLGIFAGDRELQHFDRIELSAAARPRRIKVDRIEIVGSNFRAAVAGAVQPQDKLPHELSLDWQIDLGDQGLWGGQGTLVGDLVSTRLVQAIKGPTQVNVDARIRDVLARLNWSARVEVSAFELARIIADAPPLILGGRFSTEGDLDKQRIQGQLKGESPELGAFDIDMDVTHPGDRSLQIARVELHVQESGTRLHASGDWQAGEGLGRTDLSLEWQALKWPQQGDPWFDSASGKGHLQGSLDDYRFDISTTAPRPELPPSQWQAAGRGDREHVEFERLQARILEGDLHATGRVKWSGAVTWQARVQATDINPGAHWREWPGRLATRLTVDGGVGDQGVQLDIDIAELNGGLRDYPLTLDGAVGLRGERLQLSGIALRSGGSLVRLDGTVDQSISLQWSLDSPSLAELYPELEGRLQAQGTVRGPRDQPRIDATLSGAKLGWHDYQAARLQGKVALNPLQWQQTRLQLDARALSLAGLDFDSAQLTAADDGRLQARFAGSQLGAELALKGKFDNDRWAGQIQKADFDLQRMGAWRLVSAVDASLAADAAQIGRLCWLGPENTRLCARAGWQAGNGDLELDLQQFSLALLQPWLPDNVASGGVASGVARLKLAAAGGVTGTARLQLPGGELKFPQLEEEIRQWQWRDGRIDIELADTGISAQARLLLNEADPLEITARLPGASLTSLDQRQPVAAEASLDVRDISLLAIMVPEVSQVRGLMKFRARLGGSLGRPRLDADVSLADGAFTIPRLGLEIKPFTLTGQSDEQGRFQFEAQAHSGEGNIRVSGSALLNDLNDWRAELRIDGENFEVSKIPEVRLHVSPGLTVSAAPGRIDIGGNLHVPYARLSPRDVSSAVQASDDVVIVGTEQAPQGKWRISTNVRLTLDDKRVHFIGYGFEGRLGGSLQLTDSPGQLTTASGEIKVVEGRYRAYGQRLDVRNGRLVYTGGPITNPGLDFQAVRVVGDVTAGLRVSGTLQQPQINLFSIPAMGQTDALAYLVLGRPMETTSSEDGELVAKAALALGLSGGDRIARLLGDRFGLDELRVESSNGGDQASLVIGRYLSPRLYVSYGVGLIESINTFSLRYQISSKWQLKAESGEAQGADLLYTIER